LLLINLVVEKELAADRNVAPPIGVEHRAVHCGVQLAKLYYLWVAFVGIVEAVVGLSQALVVAHHEFSTEFAVGFPYRLKVCIRLPIVGEWEGFEADSW